MNVLIEIWLTYNPEIKWQTTNDLEGIRFIKFLQRMGMDWKINDSKKVDCPIENIVAVW